MPTEFRNNRGGTPLSLCRGRFQAHLRPGKAGCLESTGAQAGSGGCVRPVAGLVNIDDQIIVLDRPPGRARRRTLRLIPQLQVPEDLLDDRSIADQADDLKWSGAAATDQRVRFGYLLDQPGPGASAAVRELFGAAGIILGRRLRFAELSRCGGGRPGRKPARVGKGAIVKVGADMRKPYYIKISRRSVESLAVFFLRVPYSEMIGNCFGGGG